MRLTILAILIAACAVASAQVYRRVAADGSVHFSSVPGADAQRIDIAPAQTIRMPIQGQAAESTISPTPEEDVFRYTHAAVVSPAAGEYLRANNGDVTLRLSLQPALKPEHAIIVTLDGERIAFDDDAIVLRSLNRGYHSVEVAVVDGDYQELIRTPPVSFFVLRAAGGG